MAEWKRVILDRIEDVEDREIHVSTVTVPTHPDIIPFLEIREFVPSRDLYGRGIIVPLTYKDRLIAAITKAKA
jgi:hypothetical protein